MTPTQMILAHPTPVTVSDFKRLLATCPMSAMYHFVVRTNRTNMKLCRGIHRLMNRVRDNQGRLVIIRVELAGAELAWLANREERWRGPTRRRLREVIRQLEFSIKTDLEVAAQLDAAWKDSIEVGIKLRRSMEIMASDA